MPEHNILLPEKYERAVAELQEKLIKQFEAARSLSGQDLSDEYKSGKFVKGWRLSFDFTEGEKEIDLLLTENFPFDKAVVALADALPPLTYPHVEDNGALCLLPDSATVSPHRPVEVTVSLLKDAAGLIEDCLSKRNQEDFRREFHSYWNRFLSDEKTKFISLLDPKPPSRVVQVWKGNGIYVFGDDAVTLEFWLQNSFGKKNYHLEPALFLWLSQTLVPLEYPKTNYDLAMLVQRQTEKGVAILSRLITKIPNQISILLGSETETGICLAGVMVRKPQSSPSAYLPNVRNPLECGFSPGKTPNSILATRYLQSTTAIGRYQVERADAAWIHGRGQDARQPNLSAATITVIGCGSVGSPVARLLAQSGVGKLRLIDPQNLTRANTGRHALGARYSGFSKAESLAREISENYPHLTTEYNAKRWEDVARTEPDIFTSSNLVISMTGDWASESALNEWQQTIENFPPILYGWTEAHACAGHAVIVFKGENGCFQCGMSEDGEPLFRVTKWKDNVVLKQEPACGVMFQPYGPVELNHTVSLISELALDIILANAASGTHRVWACRRSLLESADGEWTNEWLEESNSAVEGGCTLTRTWKARKSCESCGREEI